MGRYAAQFAILVVLIPSLSLAQSAQDQGQNSSSSYSRANEDSALMLLSTVLSLTDSQQGQLRDYFDAALKTALPVMTQIEDDKLALFAAVRSGKSEDQIKKLAEQQGNLTSQMLILQTQTFAKLWAILNPEQRSEVDDFVYRNVRSVLPAFPQ